MNRRAQLIAAWCGPACMLLFGIGGVLLARYIPPRIEPHDSPATVAAVYQEHTDSIRLGLLLMIVAFGLMGPWGVSIAVQLRRREGMFPVLTYVQVVSIAVMTALITLMCVFWAAAAFRPEADPQILRLATDLGYLCLEFTFPPFLTWCIAQGLAILLDPDEGSVYPRWAGYFNLAVAVAFAPGGTMLFFKSGVFAWHGLFALYIPVAAFGAWIVVMTKLTLDNVGKGLVLGDAALSEREGVAA